MTDRQAAFALGALAEAAGSVTRLLDILTSELHMKQLQQFGEISGSAARMIDQVVAELQNLRDEMRADADLVPIEPRQQRLPLGRAA